MTVWQRLSLTLGIGLRDLALTLFVGLMSFYLFVLVPLTEIGLVHRAVTFSTLLLVLLTSIPIVARSRGWAAIIAVLGLSIVPVEVWRIADPTPLSATVLNAHAAFFLTVLTFVLIRRVMARGRVNWHRILGAVGIYLSLGLIGGALCTIIEINAPGAYTIPAQTPLLELNGTLTYFSFVTLTSTGYGDILPVHPLARALANLVAIVGQLFPAILIARLVSLAVREE